ncbi:MAG: hypothetical protein D6763_05890 [Alphaproteobacteria bacterium]|nr:MAG: hypothetical protein D6763_05890 [Alphaproteobacteria bacterium]
MKNGWLRFLASVLIVAFAGGLAAAAAADRPLLVLSTTSVENSGLMAYLLPKFEAKAGFKVVLAAFGTGQAIRAARNGDADLLIVHDKPSELAFMADGFGVERREFMYNDFLVVGPVDDPARIAGMTDVEAALRRIVATGALFVSRGDTSGTHKAELRLWAAAGLDPNSFDVSWYRAVGAGMGATLNAAAGMQAYTLVDRGTWLAFRNRRVLKALVEGDPRFVNQYSVLLINPERHPHLQHDKARVLADWLVSPEGQDAIGSFRVAGEQLFVPNAHQRNASRRE